MATYDSLDTQIIGMYKEYIAGQKLEFLTSRTDPFIEQIATKPAGGKYYPLPMLNATNGNAGSNFTLVYNNAANKISIEEPKMMYGRLFCSWVLDPLEFLQSNSMEGAFEKIGIANMMASMELTKRYLGSAFYGLGQGEIGQLSADAASGATVLYLPLSAIIRLDLQSRIVIQSSVTQIPDLKAASCINSGTAYSISNISRSGGYITLTAGISAACSAGTWVGLEGSVTTSGSSLVPTGLGGWVPSVGNRTGTDWNTYIGTSFYGIDRSAYIENLAGSFVTQVPGESMAQTIIAAIDAQRTAGGYAANSVVLMNNQDYRRLTTEIGSDVSYYKYAQGAGKNDAPTANLGFNSIKAAFSTSMIGDIMDSTYCPVGTFYVLEKDNWFFAAMSKHDRIFSGAPKNNEPGQPEVSDASEVPNQYAMLVDEWISTQPYNVDNGQGMIVTLNMYGNFACNKPSHNVVGTFEAVS
jgi:hypothetical protein